MNSANNSLNNTIVNNRYGPDLSDDDIFIIRISIETIAGLSLLGLLFVEIMYWFFKSLRSFAFELVMWLCFSNIIYNITFFLPSDSKDTLFNYWEKNISTTCTIQALLVTFSDLSSMIWTTIIGYTAYKSVNDYEQLKKNKGLFRAVFLCLAFIPAIAFTLM
jgi:hypothetical protein